ncbi:trichohyalin-like [Gigantopelta aegis]|uniref:trichohyalin-like n=1 Tax=Gigantopelta aegis TaxID=1735272 RepID=UPI001B88993C|nr:trichohyalin-like [Gigantopelta aegis]
MDEPACATCADFQPQAWRKSLCRNCFHQFEEHSAEELGAIVGVAKPPASKAAPKSDPKAPGQVKDKDKQSVEEPPKGTSVTDKTTSSKQTTKQMSMSSTKGKSVTATLSSKFGGNVAKSKDQTKTELGRSYGKVSSSSTVAGKSSSDQGKKIDVKDQTDSAKQTTDSKDGKGTLGTTQKAFGIGKKINGSESKLKTVEKKEVGFSSSKTVSESKKQHVDVKEKSHSTDQDVKKSSLFVGTRAAPASDVSKVKHLLRSFGSDEVSSDAGGDHKPVVTGTTKAADNIATQSHSDVTAKCQTADPAGISGKVVSSKGKETPAATTVKEFGRSYLPAQPPSPTSKSQKPAEKVHNGRQAESSKAPASGFGAGFRHVDTNTDNKRKFEVKGSVDAKSKFEDKKSVKDKNDSKLKSRDVILGVKVDSRDVAVSNDVAKTKTEEEKHVDLRVKEEAALVKEIEDLKLKVSELSALKLKENELNTKEQKLKDLEKKEKDLKGKESEIFAREEKLKDLLKKEQELLLNEKKLHSREEELKLKEKVLKDLKTKETDLETKAKRQIDELKSKEQSLLSKEKEIKDFKVKQEELKSKEQTLLSKEKDLKELKAKQEEIKSKEQTLLSKEKELKDLKAKQEELKAKEKEIKDLKLKVQEIQAKEKELRDLKAKESISKSKDLELRQKENELDKLKKRLVEMEEKSRKLDEENAALKKAALQHKKEETEKQLTELQRHLGQMEERCFKLESDNKSLLDKLHEQETEVRRDSHGHKELGDLDSHLVNSEKECRDLDGENLKLRNEIIQLREEMDEMYDTFRENEVEEFRDLQKEMEYTAKNCRILQFKLRKAERQNEQLDSDRKQYEERLRLLQSQFESEDARTHIDMLEKELAIAKEVSVRLHDELDMMEDKRVKCEEENRHLTDLLEQTDKKQFRMEMEIDRLKDQIIDLQNEIKYGSLTHKDALERKRYRASTNDDD